MTRPLSTTMFERVVEKLAKVVKALYKPLDELNKNIVLLIKRVEELNRLLKTPPEEVYNNGSQPEGAHHAPGAVDPDRGGVRVDTNS